MILILIGGLSTLVTAKIAHFCGYAVLNIVNSTIIFSTYMLYMSFL